MTVTLNLGDCVTWAREYSGEPFHALLCDPPLSRNGLNVYSGLFEFIGVHNVGAFYVRHYPAVINRQVAFFEDFYKMRDFFSRHNFIPFLLTLYFCIGFAVTNFAKCNEIRELISFFVSFNSEETERRDVVYVFTHYAAMLANTLISCNRLALLRLPVWTTAFVRSFDVLRVIFSDAMNITTSAGAIFTAALPFVRPAIEPKVSLFTIQACIYFTVRRLFEFTSGILAGRRTVFTTTPFEPGRDALKFFSAMGASEINHKLYYKVRVGTRQA